MNDRFKFRVWAKPHEPTKTEGYYVDDADYMVMTPDGKVQIEYYCDNGYDGYIDRFEQDEVVIEQCTGLKDNNGKLIYENDIIKCPSGIYRIAVDDFGLWTAIYNNNPFEGVGEWSDMVKEYAFNQENVELEVLGNIHKNADLIKVGGK